MNRQLRHEVPSGDESQQRAAERRAEQLDFVADWVVPAVVITLVVAGIWRGPALLLWLDGLL